jgi:hypothetical protein
MFSNMRGGLRRDSVVRSRFADGVLYVTFQNANDAKDEDQYAMSVQGDRAELAFDDAPPSVVIPPYLFQWATTGTKVSTDWEANRAHVAGDSDAPSDEMNTIYVEDQRVRMVRNIDWQIVNKTDAARREQTRKLLIAGALHTGKDYEEAAFVLQHGDSSQDYLLAHTLAMVAVSIGDATAIWIAAATLDRYLEKSGRSRYSAQFSSDPKGSWTQEPYDRGLVSDAVRQQLGVPSQASQTEQLKAYQAHK